MHLIERASEITIFKNMIQENNSAGASSYLLPISSVIKYESSEFKHISSFDDHDILSSSFSSLLGVQLSKLVRRFL